MLPILHIKPDLQPAIVVIDLTGAIDHSLSKLLDSLVEVLAGRKWSVYYINSPKIKLQPQTSLTGGDFVLVSKSALKVLLKANGTSQVYRFSCQDNDLPKPVKQRVVEAPPEALTLEIFVINHALLANALELANQLGSSEVKVTVLSASSPNDQAAQLADPRVVKFPDSYYYSHLWNEVVKRSRQAITGVVTSDVTVPDARLLIDRCLSAFKSRPKCGIWAPDVDYTYFRYKRNDLKWHDDLAEVPTTDSTCWFLRQKCLQATGFVNCQTNKFGYGIDLLASLRARQLGFEVLRDYGLEIVHPPSKRYSDAEAQHQEKIWVRALNLTQSFYALKNEALRKVDTTRPKVSFCTTCMGRLHHVKLTLTSNLALNKHEDCEFVLLDYGSQDGLENWVMSEFKQQIDLGRLFYHRLEWPRQFHVSRAKNCVHKLARGRVLVNLDADNFSAKELTRKIEELTSNPGVVARSSTPDAKFHYSSFGLIAYHRADFIKAGGYEEKMIGYGYEDSHFIAVAKARGLGEVMIPWTLTAALEHHDALRVENYPTKDKWQSHNQNVGLGLPLQVNLPANLGRCWGSLLPRY